jgi:LysR family transcriptional regulator, nitrogen assimilation regulatory protein
VDLRQLTALVTVAEVGSVTKAARLLYVVQPAITRQIRVLEKEIGVPLFDRTRLERARAEIRPDR